MSILRDDQYRGFATEILGDGSSDSSTRGVSEYVERRFDANNRYLHQAGSRVCYSPPQVQEGGTGNARTLSALKGPSSNTSASGDARTERGAIRFIWPVIVFPYTERFRLNMLGRIFYEGYSVGKAGVVEYDLDYQHKAVGVKLQLRALQSQGTQRGESKKRFAPVEVPTDPKLNHDGWEIWKPDTAQQSKNVQYSVETEHVQEHLDIPTGGVQMDLVFTFRSFITSDEDANVQATDDTSVALHYGPLINLGSDTSSPPGITDNDFAGVNGVGGLYVRGIVNDSMIHDIVFASDDGSYSQPTGTNDGQWGAFLGFHRGARQGHGSMSGAQIRAPTQMVPMSWFIEEIHDPEYSGTQWVSKKDSSMDARRNVSGSGVTQQASNLDSIYQRPQIVALGPDGRRARTSSVQEPWDSAMGQRWSGVWVDDRGQRVGNSSANAPDDPSRMDKQSVTLRRGTGGDKTLRCFFYYTLAEVDKGRKITDYQTPLANGVTTHISRKWLFDSQQEPVNPSDFDAGSVDLTFGIGYAHGDSESALTAENTKRYVNRPIYWAGMTSAAPLMMQHNLALLPEWRGQSEGDEWSHVFTEGQLYEYDMDYLNMGSIDVQVDDSWSGTEPLDVYLWLESYRSHKISGVARTDADSSQRYTVNIDRVRLTVVSTCWYEVAS